MKKTNFICTVSGCGKTAVCQTMCSAHYRRFRRHGSPLLGRSSKGARAQFARYALTYQGDECLIPSFPQRGYWMMQIDGKQRSGHRWVCEQVNGAPPEDWYHAAHSCGNGDKGCVNPRHLRWATPSENSADKELHGRPHYGETSPRAKLKRADVEEVIRIGKRKTQADIASQFGVDKTTIGAILRGKNWKSVSRTVRTK